MGRRSFTFQHKYIRMTFQVSTDYESQILKIDKNLHHENRLTDIDYRITDVLEGFYKWIYGQNSA